MDVDTDTAITSADVVAVSTETAAAPADQEVLVAELGQLLEQIAAEPSNIRFLRRQVDLMLQLEMLDEAADAVEAVCNVAFLGEALWLKFIDAKIKNTSSPLMLEGFADVLELFTSAEDEYLSIAILERHARFVIGVVDEQGEDGREVDPEVKEFLTPDHVRGMLRAVATKADGLLSQSSQVWQLWADWELGILARAEGDEKSAQLENIHEMYLERLQVPHSTHDATFSAYSTLCTEHCPLEYEQRLVSATDLSQPAKIKWSLEKRRGKTRADFEEQLVYSADAGHQAQTLLAYIDWETDPLAKKPRGRKGPRQDVTLTRAVFERTVLVYGNAAAAAEQASFAEAAAAAEGQNSMIEAATAYKTAEALVWSRYIDWMSENTKDDDSDETAVISGRASRACPGSGELWTRLLNSMEERNDVTGIETTVQKAKDLIVGNSQPVSALVDLLYAHASILHRRYRELEPTLEHPVFLNLTAALETVSEHYKAGDPSLRLEKFFISWAEAVAAELLPGVMAVLDKPVKSRMTSYQLAILRADAQARQGDVEAARAVYTNTIQRSDLDWPEAVYEAFVLFENVYGTLETTVDARKRVDREQQKVNRRRQKQAEEEAAQQAAYAQQYQTAAQYQAAAEPAVPTDTSVAIEVDVPAGEAVAAETVSEPAPAPEPAPEEETHIKRDRENTTVLVSGLKKSTTSETIESFFENCGKVREVTILPGDGESATALVEFKFDDAVPAALDKDRKKVDGAEVHVTMLWRSTLFVTNFGRTTDDAALRKLFSQYGGILQTRWPSRKYADSRRFCYITMESPAAAQNALILHDFKVDGDFPLTVLISDPSAKKKRTDEESTKATLFVGGLNAMTTEGEVRKLLSSYGNIVNIKLGWDHAKRICKGFAFVEMATPAEATAALAANGTPFHGKGLKVEVSDPHHANKKRTGAAAPKGPKPKGPNTADARAAAERRARQVRLYDLPAGTQEGLLQQALEKIVPVKRLEIFTASGQALVELESQHDAGLLLLRPEPFVFNDVTIRIGDHTGRPPAHKPDGKPTPAAPQSSLAFVPRARKAKTLGKAYAPPKKAAATAPGPDAVAAGSGQDSFRAFMAATNEKRKDKLSEEIAGRSSGPAGTKHPREEGGDGEKGGEVADRADGAKRPKTE